MNEIKALEADTKAQEEADKTGFQSKEAALKEELAKLSAELAKRKDEDREKAHTEEVAERKKSKDAIVALSKKCAALNPEWQPYGGK